MADIFNMVDTWNNAGTTYTSIKMNVTDTASNAASLLLDLQIGGASRFRVRKDGQVIAAEFNGNTLVGDQLLFTSNQDVIITRDAANILAQRNGANAQIFRTYYSYTDAANYTRLALKTATGVHTIETESAGTGEANIDLALTPKGTGRVRFGTHAAVGAETVTGYITIKDSGGTERKIAVVS